MSRRTEKRRYGKYNKFDVVYADFGKNPHGIQGGIRPGIIISCDASNHDGAPQVSVVPLSSKLKDIPVHVILAKDAKACYKVNQLVLVNLDIIDEYLETFHIVDDEFYK